MQYSKHNGKSTKGFNKHITAHIIPRSRKLSRSIHSPHRLPTSPRQGASPRSYLPKSDRRVEISAKPPAQLQCATGDQLTGSLFAPTFQLVLVRSRKLESSFVPTGTECGPNNGVSLQRARSSSTITLSSFDLGFSVTDESHMQCYILCGRPRIHRMQPEIQITATFLNCSTAGS